MDSSNNAMPPVNMVPTPQYNNNQQQFQSDQPNGYIPRPNQNNYANQQQLPQQQGQFQQNNNNNGQNMTYLANALLNQGVSNSGTKNGLEDMVRPTISFDDALTAKRRSELLADYEIVKSMNLIDSDDTLDHMLTLIPGFSLKPFKVSMLSSLYHQKYADLVQKYESVSIYIEFAVNTIVYNSEAALKNFCTSRSIPVVRNRDGSFLKAFGSRKRVGTDGQSGSSKRAKTVELHPFLKTTEYTGQPNLYSIGKCDYFAPSEFAELFTSVKFDQITRMMNQTTKVTAYGLRVSLSKPIVCVLVSKDVANYTFTSLEYLSGLGDVLSIMADLGKLEDTFAFGTKQGMVVDRLDNNSTKTYKSGDRFEGLSLVVINNMQVGRLSNNTLSSKTYSNRVICLPENEMSEVDLKKCHTYIDEMSEKYNDEIDAYKRLLAKNEDDEGKKEPTTDDNNKN
ncbi:GrBNV gp06-like protein [Tomelloso virus]|uniref:GrBNV gp06-like protein n=1 Tax=Tomelloso virus TaxID=2053981 RepID=A0A2H4T2N9_9VIRU|nr:GrBNV gp06-like protein [Tomelloso virus]ATY70195.1 GrBNV gp06-like protein [Tomelloso virus]